MAVGRNERFEERKPRVVAVFGDDAKTLRPVFEVFTLMEMAWHDCYGEITPPEEVVENVFLCSGGTIDGLISAAHLAVIDRRDLWIAAEAIRSKSSGAVTVQGAFAHAGAGGGFCSSRGRETATLGFVQLPTAGSGMNSRTS